VIDTKYDSLRRGWCSKQITGSFEWECRNIKGRGAMLFQNLLDKRWVMGQRSIFYMMCDVGINH
jgi:hypothetical protein